MALSSVICHCKERIKSRSWRACRIHSGDSQASDTVQPLRQDQRTGLSITITPAITFFMLKTPQLAAENFKSAGGSRFRYTQRADAEPLCQYEYFRAVDALLFPIRLQRCDQTRGDIIPDFIFKRNLIHAKTAETAIGNAESQPVGNRPHRNSGYSRLLSHMPCHRTGQIIACQRGFYSVFQLQEFFGG